MGEKRNQLTPGCSACPSGKYALQDNTAYTCILCDAGQYTDNTVVVKGACKNCTAGRAQPESGQTECDLCDGLMGFQSQAGQSTCDTCAAYTKPTSNHDDCVCVDPCPAVREGKLKFYLRADV